MKKKLIAFTIVIIALILSLVACSVPSTPAHHVEDETKASGTETVETAEPVVPTYIGMYVVDESAGSLSFDQDGNGLMPLGLTIQSATTPLFDPKGNNGNTPDHEGNGNTNNGNGNPGNNGNSRNGKGSRQNDGDGEYLVVDETEDNYDGLIEDLIGIKVLTSDEISYFVTKSETFIIAVKLSNPNDYEIQSFTLNGTKYANYMFEAGSDMETLYLKVTAPDDPGYVAYTIDAIKYIDGTEIKDVDMTKGDQTIKVGIL